ncbi:hypothetical protein GAY28_36485 [Azospirillum brasilense]|nr:hypothetical protein [Azospirillum brasilense]
MPTPRVTGGAGDAALFGGADDAAGMVAALAAARDPERRAGLAARGLAQAARFTFGAMAETMAAHLLDSAAKLKAGHLAPPPPVWQELRATQAAGMAAGAGDEEDESPWVLRRRLQRSEQHLRTVQNELTSMQNSPFWRLRTVTLGVLVRLGVKWRR